MENTLILSLIVIFLFSLASETAFANTNLGIECPAKNSSSNYEMIFECYKKLDVNKAILEKMFGDIRWISGTFNDAKLYNIDYQGSTGSATMEIPIPIPVVSPLISDIKFTQNNSNYQINFLTGKLAGSEMSVSVTAADSFDGISNMGSDVSLKFKLKKKMCLTWGIICASPNEVMHALDKGLTLLEPKAKLYQKNNPENIIIPSDPKTDENPTASTTQNKSFVDQKTYDEIQTAPVVKKVAKEFESQPKKEYFPIATLPKNIQGSDKITIIADKSVYVYGTNIILTTIVSYVNNQPIFLEFYNADNELVLTKQAYPDSNGFSKESFGIGMKLPAKIHDIFTIFASYGDSKVSEKVYLSDFGVSVELDQKTYIPTEKVYLTIIAPDFNRNSNVIDTIGDDEESSLTISTNRGYITDYTLVEIREDAGIFAGEITLVADGSTGGASPTGGKLATYPEDELQVWLSESHRDVIKTAKISAGIRDTVANTPQISEDMPSITIQPAIPSWIKNNAEWWTSELISDEDFINAIEYMIKEKIISISVSNSETTKNVQDALLFTKYAAESWIDGSITDEQFVKGLEYLVKQGIININ